MNSMAQVAPLPDAVTLDQLRVFLAVAEQGSFSAAARRLRRAQSAVSYAIANLERILGVLLFEREGRTPSLTEAGRSLLGETKAIHGQVEQLTARARSMGQGVEPRLAPLAKIKGTIPMKTMERHVQLVLSDRSRLTEGVDLGVLEGPTWRLADLGAKHEFLRAGFGWGGMPLHLVAEDLEAGRLVWISPVEWSAGPREVPLYGIHRADDLPGPAGRWLLDRLEHAAGRADSELDRLKNKCSSRKAARVKA